MMDRGPYRRRHNGIPLNIGPAARSLFPRTVGRCPLNNPYHTGIYEPLPIQNFQHIVSPLRSPRSHSPYAATSRQSNPDPDRFATSCSCPRYCRPSVPNHCNACCEASLSTGQRYSTCPECSCSPRQYHDPPPSTRRRDRCDICDAEAQCPQCVPDACHRCCGGNNRRSTCAYDTKDVVVRGKTYAIRKTYLSEVSKFEDNLVKYMEKASEDAVPDRIVCLLISFINEEKFQADSLHDLITLNILASNVGAKSVVDYSMDEINRWDIDRDLSLHALVDIVVTIMLSGKVEQALQDWLRKYLKYNDRWSQMVHHQWYHARVMSSRPEVDIRLRILMGYRSAMDDEGFRIL
ncbi:hypothetical protein F5884DRAFT_524900 [Xylogone sp. PMI_703]|nr:hypothetical protein F5884DRAFT_524900 [Xylogone sp. PMI_703]